MILIVVATMLRPGDAPWIYDEPLLMEMAIQKNATPSHFLHITLPFTPATYGLKGTRGLGMDRSPSGSTRYSWHSPTTRYGWSSIRAGLVAGITAISLLWLCRTLRVSPWLAVAGMLSPWLYFYSRQIWDNSLCIPISALMLAAYADFLSTRRVRSLYLAVFCAAAFDADPFYGHPAWWPRLASISCWSNFTPCADLNGSSARSSSQCSASPGPIGIT